MTTDLVILFEMVAILAIAWLRIWQLSRDRARLSAELDAAYQAGAAVRIDRDRAVAEQTLARRALDAMEAVGDQAGRQIAELRQDRCALVVQIVALRSDLRVAAADRDAHADRVLPLARRAGELKTELEACRSRMREAGLRLDELIADNAAALGLQSGGER